MANKPAMRRARSAAGHIHTRQLESLIGYNARRVSRTMTHLFEERMALHGLRAPDFSALCLVTHNPGVTARQLCAPLRLRPSNLVGMMRALQAFGLIVRNPHPQDGRALGLHATAAGIELLGEAAQVARQLEVDFARALTPAERRTLMRLLKTVTSRDA